MKVLIISAFPPEPAPEANHALHISEHLAKSGLAVHVLCKKGSIATTQENMVVHPVIADWSWSDLPRLAKCMKRCRPDVVLLLYIGWVYNQRPMITFLPTICKTVLPGVPCVTQFENIDSHNPSRSFLSRLIRWSIKLWVGPKNVHFLFGTLLRDSARIIALSSPHRDRLVMECQEVEEKTVILPPPPLIRVCPDEPALARRRAREAIGAAETDFVVIYWGYIYPGKGVDTLLRAFRIVCNRKSNMRLVLVGGTLDFPTPEPISCKDYAKLVHEFPEQFGIAEKVTWTGHFDWDSDIGSRFLHAGDLCVLPIDSGLTLNNSSLAAASTHGLPVIGTELRVGRDEGLEHGKNIYLCRPKDPEMLADAIELIHDDHRLRERLRAGIQHLARKWHRWDTMAERMIDVLKSAVSSPEISSRNETHRLAEQKQPANRTMSLDLLRWEPDGDGSLLGPGDAAPYTSKWSEENTSEKVNTPLVSVIVAVHNVEKYLSQCLDSLVNQTLQNIEIIALDDASTDNSLNVMKEYRSRYPDLRVIECEKNLGLASVRNLGMRLARGKYIGFVDGDDWADPRKYELMYRKADGDNADIVFGGNKQFVDDVKCFIPANDQHIWDALSPDFKQTVFRATEEPRVFVMEPAVWAKLYKRAFLQEHGLEFEEGMNSVEDVIFHFTVLWHAKRISLLDAPVSYYRLNRPGQITGRKDRRLFETITVFEKTSKNLAEWDVPPAIWAGLLSTELRFFEWLLRDRIHPYLKPEFFAACARHLRQIPERGFREFAGKASTEDLAKLFYMRRGWPGAYEKINRSALCLLYVMLGYRRAELLKRVVQRYKGLPRRRSIAVVEKVVNRFFNNMGSLHTQVRALQDTVNDLIVLSARPSTNGTQEPLAEVCRIDDQTLFFCDWTFGHGVRAAVSRMKNDYFLSQVAVFRNGDTVVDVGAHVGVFSIYLAKKYPFITVYAVEPDPLNYACLKRNIDLNAATNVIAVNKAVTGDGRRTTLYVDPWDSLWATIVPSLASSKNAVRAAHVESVTLEQLFQEYDIRHCRLLKMTALGAIQESLQGFTRTGCVDLLCGEVDLAACSQVKLEMASWRIARQHFWRTFDSRAHRTVHSWIHRAPTEIECLPSQSSPHR
jgi:FkbM family methyltransferase